MMGGMFRGAFIWAAMVAAICPVAAHETDVAWIRGIYTGESPRPVALAEAEAWQRAAAIADRTPRAFVLMGMGRSMQPLYGPNTILVLRQQDYRDLKRGQTVLYRNQAQRVVAHVLVARVRDGWRVQGLGNATHDMEPVRPENFVGVVIAAFKPDPAARRLALAGPP